MAKYRSIETEFWNDIKVVDEFKPEDKYLFLYLLTNPKSNQLGCYELSISQICRDTGYKNAKVVRILENLEQNLQVIVYDYETKEVFLKNWYKYNWLNSEKTKKCIEKEFSLVKSNKLKDLISPLYAPYIPHASKKKNKEMPHTSKKEEKEEEKEIKNKKKKNREKEEENSFSDTPSFFPTLADIIFYAESLGIDNKEYCEKFYNHYDGIDWVNGSGNKIKNWKSIFNNWAKKDKLISNEEKNDDKVYFN